MKGLDPDFKNTTTEELKAYEDMIQKFIFCYDYPRGKPEQELLKKIWKDVSNEKVDRTAKSAMKSIDRQERETARESVGTSTKLIQTVSHQVSIRPKIITGKPVMTILKRRGVPNE